MIPTLNDDPAESRKLAEWILTHLGPDVPLHFTAFHPDFKLRDKPRTPAATLDRARQIALDAGLRYVYEGNIYSDGANTYCPQCSELLVRRSWHDVLENHIEDGACPKCGFAIAGVWESDEKMERGAPRDNSAPTRHYGHLNL
jgi:pyruvate formate lyase activating enzyme